MQKKLLAGLLFLPAGELFFPSRTKNIGVAAEK